MILAQLNIAQAKYDLEAPEIKDFVDNIDQVNALAESSDGFIWRLKDESGDATQIQAFSDPRTIVNMSVWRSVEALKDFMFKTHHRDFMRRKQEWFEQMPTASYVLWWIPEGTIPTIEEAKAKLALLREQGENAAAFSLKKHFPHQ